METVLCVSQILVMPTPFGPFHVHRYRRVIQSMGIQAIILYNVKGHRPQEFGASESGVEQQATSCALRRPLGAARQLQATFKATTGLHHTLANLC